MLKMDFRLLVLFLVSSTVLQALPAANRPFKEIKRNDPKRPIIAKSEIISRGGDHQTDLGGRKFQKELMASLHATADQSSYEDYSGLGLTKRGTGCIHNHAGGEDCSYYDDLGSVQKHDKAADGDNQNGSFKRSEDQSGGISDRENIKGRDAGENQEDSRRDTHSVIRQSHANSLTSGRSNVERKQEPRYEMPLVAAISQEGLKFDVRHTLDGTEDRSEKIPVNGENYKDVNGTSYSPENMSVQRLQDEARNQKVYELNKMNKDGATKSNGDIKELEEHNIHKRHTHGGIKHDHQESHEHTLHEREVDQRTGELKKPICKYSKEKTKGEMKHVNAERQKHEEGEKHEKNLGSTHIQRTGEMEQQLMKVRKRDTHYDDKHVHGAGHNHNEGHKHGESHEHTDVQRADETEEQMLKVSKRDTHHDKKHVHNAGHNHDEGHRHDKGHEHGESHESNNDEHASARIQMPKLCKRDTLHGVKRVKGDEHKEDDKHGESRGCSDDQKLREMIEHIPNIRNRDAHHDTSPIHGEGHNRVESHEHGDSHQSKDVPRAGETHHNVNRVHGGGYKGGHKHEGSHRRVDDIKEQRPQISKTHPNINHVDDKDHEQGRVNQNGGNHERKNDQRAGEIEDQRPNIGRHHIKHVHRSKDDQPALEIKEQTFKRSKRDTNYDIKHVHDEGHEHEGGDKNGTSPGQGDDQSAADMNEHRSKSSQTGTRQGVRYVHDDDSKQGEHPRHNEGYKQEGSHEGEDNRRAGGMEEQNAEKDLHQDIKNVQDEGHKHRESHGRTNDQPIEEEKPKITDHRLRRNVRGQKASMVTNEYANRKGESAYGKSHYAQVDQDDRQGNYPVNDVRENKKVTQRIADTQREHVNGYSHIHSARHQNGDPTITRKYNKRDTEPDYTNYRGHFIQTSHDPHDEDRTDTSPNAPTPRSHVCNENCKHGLRHRENSSDTSAMRQAENKSGNDCLGRKDHDLEENESGKDRVSARGSGLDKRQASDGKKHICDMHCKHGHQE